MRKFLVAFFISLVLGLLIGGSLLARIDQSVAGLTIVRSIGGCDVVVYDTSLQKVVTVALACPKKDLIRIWPLPVKNPWSEDGYGEGWKQLGMNENR